MNQEKIGKLIKKIRQENNLTQKDLADKYHVTYQAVSKWENGKNLPDLSLIKQISSDFNVSLDDMISGNLNIKKKKKMFTIILSIIVLIILFLVFYFVFNYNSDLHTRPIKANCDDFNIYGVLSYNSNKSAIYIPKIEYCGNDKHVEFVKIECTLNEKLDNGSKVISSYIYDENRINLDEFLKKVSFHVDNYLSVCKNANNLYLEIKGTTESNNLYYNIPLILEEDSCSST